MVQFRLNKSPSNYSSTWLCLVIGNGDFYSSTDILFGAPIYAFKHFFFFFFFFFFLRISYLFCVGVGVVSFNNAHCGQI